MSPQKRPLPTICFLLLLLGTPLHAQTPAAPPTTPAPTASFEVASLRLAEGNQAAGVSTFPTNRVYAHNLPLSFFFSLAYGVDGQYIRNAPGWAETQFYSIEAKSAGDQPLTYDQAKPLLQALLAERLHLVAHRQTEILSGFDLVLAKGGPKLQPAQGTHKGMGALMADGIQAWGANVDALCSILTHPAGKPIADKTGLTGTYDAKLSFAPPGDPNSPLPDFFTAIQEQLGLKLIPAKVPVETLVIDHIDRTPTEN